MIWVPAPLLQDRWGQPTGATPAAGDPVLRAVARAAARVLGNAIPAPGPRHHGHTLAGEAWAITVWSGKVGEQDEVGLALALGQLPGS